jgi:hypothetical protein
MKKKILVMAIILLAVLVSAVPALADEPAEGTAYEGVSVPGVALGDTRAQVQAAYGNPYSCTSGYHVDDDATCSYSLEGFDHLGRVWINFRGPVGGLPNASPNDVLYSVT